MPTQVKVNTKPILFSAPMVRAILDGRKTMTRRVVRLSKWSNPHHAKDLVSPLSEYSRVNVGLHTIDETSTRYFGALFSGETSDVFVACPYGVVGDRLWVREAFSYRGLLANDNIPDDRRRGVTDATCGVHYWCDGDPEFGDWARPTSPIYMPRWASRITLEITDVRVERLQEITDADISAEGLTQSVIESVIESTAARFKTVPEHWIHGWDEGFSFCRGCAEKKVAELLAKEPNEEYLVDGGWGIEGDSQQFCETCHVALDNSYTDYCCEQELDHFDGSTFTHTSPDDCHALSEILGAQGWDGEMGPRVRRLGWRAAWNSLNAKRGYSWESNPWVWVLSFKKV